jgi:hypothetical protein
MSWYCEYSNKQFRTCANAFPNEFPPLRAFFLSAHTIYTHNIRTYLTILTISRHINYTHNIRTYLTRIVELNKNIDGFYTKTTQKGGFSKLCVKIKKRCYTDLLHFLTRKHNLVSFTCGNALPNEFTV